MMHGLDRLAELLACLQAKGRVYPQPAQLDALG
jgi:hypothetical protein